MIFSDLRILWSVAIAILLPLAVGVAVWRVLRHARTPQGSVAWVVFLLSSPWFALPAYLFFGHHKLHGYTKQRRASHEAMKRLESYAQAVRPREQRPEYRLFERLAGLPVVGGNALELLVDGDAVFPAIFAAIDRAEDYVLVQYYTIVDDETGGALADHLIAAAGRGVTVRVIYDGVGSYGLSAEWRARLSEAGVEVLDPRSARGPTSRLQVNFRNHRKTVIVDGREGFLGGLNMSDTYRGLNPKFGAWRDTHLKLTGPAVAQLQLAYIEDWHWATGEAMGPSLFWTPAPRDDGADAVIVPCGPVDTLDTGALFYFAAISDARERVWIASPYFVPDGDILSALKTAALRGCDVRVLIPDSRDHWPTWLAAFAYFDEVRDAGVKIYRYKPGFMHQKVVLTDDRLVGIGTANLDNRSFRLNFETMAAVFDHDFAGEVAAMLEADFAAAEPMTQTLGQRPLWLRAGALVSRLMAPVL
ncbi:cardiolipin synthase [Salipiger abyssi]|uniref:cardiolipin synthase n=1 Tax=Salipiger abyssi TaxID=1250539 RepID=UPI0040585841